MRITRVHDIRVATGLLVLLGLFVTAGHVQGRERHAGTVIAVDPGSRTLTLDEFGANAVRQTRTVRLSPGVTVVMSERNEPVTDFTQVFNDTPISVADVRVGDFVVAESLGKPDVAERVIVTLRRAPSS